MGFLTIFIIGVLVVGAILIVVNLRAADAMDTEGKAESTSDAPARPPDMETGSQNANGNLIEGQVEKPHLHV